MRSETKPLIGKYAFVVARSITQTDAEVRLMSLTETHLLATSPHHR
jgi:hypothetical protein